MGELYRIWNVEPRGDGGLVLMAQPYAGPNVEARGFYILTVPPGNLAGGLYATMGRGELWRLDVADDDTTVIAAAYAPHGGGQ